MKIKQLLIVVVIATITAGCSKKTNDVVDEQLVQAGAKLNGTWVQTSSTIYYYDAFGNSLGTVTGPMANLKLNNGSVKISDAISTQNGQFVLMTASRGDVLELTLGSDTHYYDITVLHPPNLTLSETIGGLNTPNVVLGGSTVPYSKSVQVNMYTSPDARN